MIVDIVILVIIVIMIIIGILKGLTATLVDIFSFIIALIVALLLCKPLGNMIINNTQVDDNIKGIIVKNIPMNDADFKVDNTEGLPEFMKNQINSVAISATQTKDQAIEGISNELTKNVIYVACFVIIFIVTKITLLIIKILSKVITKLPVLKQADKLGGAIAGAVEGIMIVYFSFIVISLISPVLEGTKVIPAINESYVGKFMYNNNVLSNKFLNIK